MHYVYVLKNKKAQEIYYGYTNNLERRIADHNRNQEWILVYYEAYLAEKDTRERERKLKHYGQSKAQLKNRIKESFEIQN